MTKVKGTTGDFVLYLCSQLRCLLWCRNTFTNGLLAVQNLEVHAVPYFECITNINLKIKPANPTPQCLSPQAPSVNGAFSFVGALAPRTSRDHV